jgi:uncharacterized membrane protein
MRAITFGLRALISVLFLYAGSAKLIDPVSFLESLLALAPINGSLLVVLTLLLPIFEIVIGIALWVPWSKRAAPAGAFSLLLIFAGVSAYLLLAKQDLYCPCFGENSLFNLPPAGALVRNLGLAAGSLLILVRESSPRSGAPQ